MASRRSRLRLMRVAVLGACTIAVAAWAGPSAAAPSRAAAKHVTVVLGVKGFEYYTALSCGAIAEGKKLGVNVSVTGPSSFAPPAQITVVNAVTAQHPDGAIVAPDDSKALLAPLKKLLSRGTKLVEVDTATIPPLGATQITSNNQLGGKQAADEMAKLLGGKGSVLVISTAPGVTTEDLRIAAFKAELKKHPGVKIVSTQYDGANLAKSTNIASSTLTANPNLGGIFTTNLLSSEGIIPAIQKSGKAGKVKVVAFDSNMKLLGDLQAGTIQSLVVQRPYDEGADAVQQLVNSLNGKTVAKPFQTGIVTVTKANLATTRKYIYQSSC